VRDFPVTHRQVPGPGQTLLAALVGARGFAQTVRAARAAGVVLRVLRPQGARDQNFPGHSQLVGRFCAIAVYPPAAGTVAKDAARATAANAGWHACWAWGHAPTWVLPERGMASPGDHSHAWTGKFYLVSSAIFCHLRRNPWNS
jgi:hypothetical protein